MPNLSENYQTICNKFPELVKKLEILDEEEGFVKVRIKLNDKTILHATENRKSGIYSYYWLSEKINLIIGWDNYPHHPQIKTFPFHKHVKKKENIKKSEPQTLESVLREIRKELSK